MRIETTPIYDQTVRETLIEPFKPIAPPAPTSAAAAKARPTRKKKAS